jgi:hypothetical protein
MERGLRQVGYAEADIESIIAELMGAFKESEEAGEAKWQQTRKKVLRRRSETARRQKAKELEAEAIKSYTGQRKRSAMGGAEVWQRRGGRDSLTWSHTSLLGSLKRADPSVTSCVCRRVPRK